MSLASLLLDAKSSGGKKSIDTELDAMFKSHTTVEDRASNGASNNHPAAGKKKKHGSEGHADGPKRKRSRHSPPDTVSLPSPREEKKIGKEPTTEDSKPGSSKALDPQGSESISAQGASLEAFDQTVDGIRQPPTLLTHETLQKGKPHKPASRKAKYAPPGESQERRNARTIFIGNLVPDVAIKHPLQKQLHRYILASVPTAKIESTRFRSVAFQMPTRKLSEATGEMKRHKQPRQHERDRASSWRDANTSGESRMDEKKFLTPSQKKKIAFINRDIHPNAASVHAYIIFAYPSPDSRTANLPSLPPVMDPVEAARLAVERCNGTVFLDRTLRVDRVANPDSPSDIPLSTSIMGDPKFTIFIGNLDFASKEEDLRVFFERVVSAERGPPGPQDDNKPKCWVTHTRMIRDKDTQLGKGFAYVQFSDRTCVDEVLSLEPGKLKFAKRKLRVQRCKSVPNIPSGKTTHSAKPAKTPKCAPIHIPPVPQGDPSLGEKLVELTKEERKRVKAADADRVARRVAKKQARMALAKQGVPSRSKQRERVRKTGAAKTLGGGPPKKASKGRVRSEKCIARKNTKK